MSLRFMPCDPGSSPRMRGTLAGTIPVDAVHGIIPAYAGNTRERHGTVSDRRDHPRVCGEHILGDSNADIHRGSSPRMRGTRGGGIGALRLVGIIPAYVGNTPHTTCSWSRNWDHPRVCGEHHTCTFTGRLGAEPSPRMRGTPNVRLVGRLGLGIIPAYAGNTYRMCRSYTVPRDHPRVCGEHEAR